ncbi:F0F1 ATP synthase subunit B [Oscillatoria salina]
MVINFLYLATEAAEAAEEGGFGLNFDILETNLINLVIIIGVLFVFGRRFLGKILEERRSKIQSEIKEAEVQAKEAAAALADAQQKLAQAQAEVEKIRTTAEQTAQKAKESILAQANTEVERIKADAVADVNTEKERAIAELKQRVATLAIDRVESRMKEILDESTQQQLIDRSIARLGGS